MKKKRKPTITSLKKKLDKIFSIYIRLRDSDESGFCECITCGKIKYWREVDAGHYYSRRYLNVRWEEINVNAQCKGCNGFGNGEIATYSVKMRKVYGEAAVKALHGLHNIPTKLRREYLEYNIKTYEMKVEEIKKEKMIDFS